MKIINVRMCLLWTENQCIPYKNTMTRKCLISQCNCIIVIIVIIIIHFRGLQLLIVPVIAGLLEVDINFSSNFETFFEQATSIVNKSIVTVFDACHCKLLKVYCDPMDRWVCATKYVYVVCSICLCKSRVYRKTCLVFW